MTTLELKQLLACCPVCQGHGCGEHVTIDRLWPVLLGMAEAIERIERRLEQID